MRLSASVYTNAVKGVLDKQEMWREEWLAFNINDATWHRKQAKYERKLIRLQQARLGAIAYNSNRLTINSN
jgi:hypothetical protein